jgi:dCMP deaminase
VSDTPPPPDHALERPDKEIYFLLIALAARTRADCIGRRHGAVVAREGRVISTGYNGTPFGVPNCSEGGCLRCRQRLTNEAPRGGAYDVCICVHAEQNAILTAARFGQQTLGGSMTCTTQPCFGCLKEMLQVGITEVRYLHSWDPVEAYGDLALGSQYDALSSKFEVFKQISDAALDTDQLFGGFLKLRPDRSSG